MLLLKPLDGLVFFCLYLGLLWGFYENLSCDLDFLLALHGLNSVNIFLNKYKSFGLVFEAMDFSRLFIETIKPNKLGRLKGGDPDTPMYRSRSS